MALDQLSHVYPYATLPSPYAYTNPPIRQRPGDGHTWMQVAFSTQTGWVAETNASGQAGNITSIPCP